MRYQEILEACWSGYQQQGMKKKGDRMVPNCVPVEEATGDPFLDNAARELLGFVLLFGTPFVIGAYLDIRNKLRKYQGREIIDALERKGVTMNRQTYDKVKPVLDRFDQAVRDNEGAEAKALAKRIEQMIIMGKLSAAEPRTADTALAAKEKELAEDLKKWFKEKWVRFGPDGKIRGACARGSEGEGKPKCLPQSKAHALGKKGRASAAAKKRREDPNPERRGPARNVATKVKEQGVAEMDKSQKSQERHGDRPLGAKGTTAKPVSAKKVVKDLAWDLDKAFAKEKKVKEDANPKFAALIKNIQARMKKDDYQRPELMKRVAQMVQQADPTVQDTMTTAQQLVQQYGQGPAPEQTHIGGIKIDPIKFKPGETPQGINAYWQAKGQAPIYKVQEQYTDDDDWYDEEDDRLRDGDYVRDRQDGEHGEIFRMSGDPSERRVRILDRDGRGWYISPERLEPVDRTDPDIMRYFGKRRHRDMDEAGSPAQQAAIAIAMKKAGKKPKHIDEKQDACYRKVKSRYKVWPSAYASGALVQCRKKGAANWGNKKK